MRRLSSLLLWQLNSLLVASTGYFSQRLATHGVDAPTAQSAIVYAILAVHGLFLCRRKAEARHSVRWWHWLAIAAADVEANYLLVLAYQFTDITSVCILDAFTVPVVMVLSACAFSQRFSTAQVSAASMCVLGIVALVTADILAQHNEPGAKPRPHAWLGDLLVLLGAALCACVPRARLVLHGISPPSGG